MLPGSWGHALCSLAGVWPAPDDTGHSGVRNVSSHTCVHGTSRGSFLMTTTAKADACKFMRPGSKVWSLGLSRCSNVMAYVDVVQCRVAQSSLRGNCQWEKRLILEATVYKHGSKMDATHALWFKEDEQQMSKAATSPEYSMMPQNHLKVLRSNWSLQRPICANQPHIYVAGTSLIKL